MESSHFFLNPCTSFQLLLWTETKIFNILYQTLQPARFYLPFLISNTPYPLHDLARITFFRCLECHVPSHFRVCIIRALCLALGSMMSPQPLLINSSRFVRSHQKQYSQGCFFILPGKFFSCCCCCCYIFLTDSCPSPLCMYVSVCNYTFICMII